MRRHPKVSTPHTFVAAAMMAVLLMCAFASTAIAGEQPNVPLIPMTAGELREAGIAVQPGAGRSLPHSCSAAGMADFSVSDEMLASFKARGFSLVSLCLGLVSFARFDPETGKPMPIAEIEGGTQVPLNLPNCFRRGLPLLDCEFPNDHIWGGPHDQQERTRLRNLGKTIEGIARKQMRTKSEARIYPYNDCSNAKAPFTVEIHGTSLCVILARVVFSQQLAAGYGYALQGPEGEDPKQETVDLSTYRKRSQGLPYWADDKSR